MQCKAGLRHLGIEEIVVGFCVRLLDYSTSRLTFASIRSNVEEIFRTEMALQCKALEDQGYAVKLNLLIGEPRAEIDRLYDAENCDLVVVGSRVRSATMEVFLGGVAGEILHHCRRPLLVARAPADEEPATECPLTAREAILFPTDFSDNAERAFAIVVQMAQEGHRPVVLFHVQDRSKLERHLKDRLDEFNAVDQSRLDRMKQELLSKGAREVSVELPYGLPSEEILRRTRRGDIALTIMGSQGRGFFGEVFLGSVSHNIARHSPAPVLLIPPLR